MRCEEVQKILEEFETRKLPGVVREHLARCSGCEAYARDWRLVRAGFRSLAEEQAPVASLGFAARLVRRLGEAAEQHCLESVGLERAGRRFLYAAALLTLTLLLSLVLPSSGPVRGPATADLYRAQTEVATAGNDPIFAPGLQDNHGAAPASLTGEGEQEQK